jgi:hypothetical protein
MADLLAQASAWLETQRTQHCASVIAYQRGSESIQLSASVGRTVFETHDEAGSVLRTESRDYLILAGDLTLGLPKPGDRIREAQGQQVLVYEVTQFGSEPCWRYSDPYRQTLRVHTKLVDVEAAP